MIYHHGAMPEQLNRPKLRPPLVIALNKKLYQSEVFNDLNIHSIVIAPYFDQGRWTTKKASAWVLARGALDPPESKLDFQVNIWITAPNVSFMLNQNSKWAQLPPNSVCSTDYILQPGDVIEGRSHSNPTNSYMRVLKGKLDRFESFT